MTYKIEARATAQQAGKTGAVTEHSRQTQVLAVRLTQDELRALEELRQQLVRNGARSDRPGWTQVTRGDTLRHCLRQALAINNNKN